MKNLKKILSAILAVVLAGSTASSLSSCDALSAVSTLSGIAEDFEKYENALSKLTNYKITIESVSEGGNKETMTEMRCDKGYGLITDDSIVYVEYGAGKMYMLSKADKTGVTYALDDDEAYKSFGLTINGYLFFFEAYKYLGAKKAGSEKINGRKTTRYTYNADGNESKFWIDDEYGLTMKFDMKSSDGETSSMEVTEFTTKSVKLSDIVTLGEYDIQDLFIPEN